MNSRFKILQEIDFCNRLGLLNELQPQKSHESWNYIASTLFCHNFCYLVSIGREDCKNLLVNASFDERDDSLPLNQFPTLDDIVNHLDEAILTTNTTGKFAALYVSKVQEYFNKFSEYDKPHNCLIRDSLHGMPPSKPFYVIDGMHRLVAFGLKSNFAIQNFPFPIFYCTNSPHR